MFPEGDFTVHGRCPKCTWGGILCAAPGSDVIACDQCNYTETKPHEHPCHTDACSNHYVCHDPLCGVHNWTCPACLDNEQADDLDRQEAELILQHRLAILYPSTHKGH